MQFSRIQAAVTSLIQIVYLVGVSLATSWYFTDHFAAGWSLPSYIGVLLACAVEGHNMAQQRQTKLSWKAWRKQPDDTGKRNTFFMNVGIVVVLVTVLSFFSLMYTTENWHTPGSVLPEVVQQVVRGLVIPLLYLLTIFVVDIETDGAERIQRFALQLYGRAINVAGKQYEKRFRAIEKGNRDATALVHDLAVFLGDTSAADGFTTINNALSAIENGRPVLQPVIDRPHQSINNVTSFSSHPTGSVIDDENDLQGVAYFELTDLERQVMMLDSQGLTQEEIATKLRIPQSRVSMTLQLIRRWKAAQAKAIATGMSTVVVA